MLISSSPAVDGFRNLLEGEESQGERHWVCCVTCGHGNAQRVFDGSRSGRAGPRETETDDAKLLLAFHAHTCPIVAGLGASGFPDSLKPALGKLLYSGNLQRLPNQGVARLASTQQNCSVPDGEEYRNFVSTLQMFSESALISVQAPCMLPGLCEFVCALALLGLVGLGSVVSSIRSGSCLPSVPSSAEVLESPGRD